MVDLVLQSGSTVSLEVGDAVAADAAAATAAQARAAAGLARWLPNKFLTRRVMASPPTLTYTPAGTTLMSGTPLFQQACDGTAICSTFNYRRVSQMKAGGGLVWDRGSTDGLVPGASTASHGSAFAFSYDSATIELAFQNQSQKIWIRVNGEYVSLTPTTLTNDGATGRIYLNFGSAAVREIEVILIGVGQLLRFAGAYIEPAAAIAPVAPRGGLWFYVGDSFGLTSGPSDPLNGVVPTLGDLLGLDNLVNSSQGGTGLLATNSGTKLTYRGRLAADVLAYAPDGIIIQGSINDGTASPAAVQAELALLIADIKAALPTCQIAVTGLMSNVGGGYASANFYLVNDAMKAACASAGVSFTNLMEQDLPLQTAQSGTITRVAAANATRLYTNIQLAKNTTIRLADGTHGRIVLGTASGTGDYICDVDKCINGAAVGTTFTVVGNSLWSGNGKVGATNSSGNCDRLVSSDGIHPSDAGAAAIAHGIGYDLIAKLGA